MGGTVHAALTEPCIRVRSYSDCVTTGRWQRLSAGDPVAVRLNHALPVALNFKSLADTAVFQLAARWPLFSMHLAANQRLLLCCGDVMHVWNVSSPSLPVTLRPLAPAASLEPASE